MKRWQQLLTVVILATLAFGGSFTCNASNNDDDKPPPANPRR